MFARIQRLYNTDRLSAEGVQNAVTREWITQGQADEILAPEPEPEPEIPIGEGV